MKKDVRKLDEIAEFASSHTFRSRLENAPGGTVYVLQLRDVRLGKNLPWDDVLRIQELPGRNHLLYPSDLLFSMRGSNYSIFFLYEVRNATIASSQFFRIRIKTIASNLILPEFLAWQLNQKPAKSYYAARETGSTVRSIRMSEIRTMPIVIPPIKRQRELLQLGERITEQNALLRNITKYNQDILDEVAQKELKPE
jgi:hypothetical protein